MSANFRFKTIQIQNHLERKAFYRHSIPEPSSAKKGTVNIDILEASRNGGSGTS